MKLSTALMTILLVFTCVALACSSMVSVYARFADDGVYDVTYLEQIDATCVKSIYQGKVVMDCMEGRRIEVQP